MKSQLADLIEKNRALICLFEEPGVIRYSASKGAANVPEKLTLLEWRRSLPRQTVLFSSVR